MKVMAGGARTAAVVKVQRRRVCYRVVNDRESLAAVGDSVATAAGADELVWGTGSVAGGRRNVWRVVAGVAHSSRLRLSQPQFISRSARDPCRSPTSTYVVGDTTWALSAAAPGAVAFGRDRPAVHRKADRKSSRVFQVEVSRRNGAEDLAPRGAFVCRVGFCRTRRKRRKSPAIR